MAGLAALFCATGFIVLGFAMGSASCRALALGSTSFAAGGIAFSCWAWTL